MCDHPEDIMNGEGDVNHIIIVLYLPDGTILEIDRFWMPGEFYRRQ